MLNVLTCHHGHQTGLVDVCEGSQLSHCQDGLHMGVSTGLSELPDLIVESWGDKNELSSSCTFKNITLELRKTMLMLEANVRCPVWKNQCKPRATGLFKRVFLVSESFSVLVTHTCPLPSECQSPVYDNIDLCSTILHGHLYLLKTGLQWCLSSRETSSHWSKRTRKREREVRQCSCTLSGKMFEEGMKRVLR